MKDLSESGRLILDITKGFVSLLMFCMLCAGCDDVIEQIPITMKLSADMLDFESDGGERTITVETNTNRWKVESAISWLSVRQSADAKNGEIFIAAERNATLTQREATVTVKGTGIETRTIKVTVKGAPVKLDVPAAPLHFPAAGGQQSFSITSNTDWTISIDTIYDLWFELDWWYAGWLEFSQDKGANDCPVSVTAAANPLIFQRTQTITISGPSNIPARSINVTQEGRNEPPSLILSKNKLDFSADNSPQEEYFDITSNTSWVVNLDKDVDWIYFAISNPYFDRYEGRCNGRIIIGKFLQNTSPTPRSTILSVTAEGVPTQYIEVTQAAAAVEAASVFGNNTVAAGSYGGGNGTPNTPYLINNASQLKRLVNESNNGSHYANTCFKLMTDIEVTANEWIPIGRTNYFRGVFDGNGYTVSGTLRSGRYAYFGFFSGLDAGARISNLTIAANVSNEMFSTNVYVATGAIAGVQFGAAVSIDNCAVAGMVAGGFGLYDYTGGILGAGQQSVSIQSCNVANHITGRYATGGIVGEIVSGQISNCTVYAYSIRGDNAVGGIAGSSHTVQINNCTNHAEVYNGNYVGGIAGYNYYGAIHTCLNTGPISGSRTNTGGLAGNNDNNPAAHIYSCCTNRGTVNGQTAIAGNQVGYGKAVEACPVGHTKR